MSEDAEQVRQQGHERSLLEGALDYLSILLKYKWLIIILTSAATAGVLVFAVISIVLPPDVSPMPNIYQASATLLVSETGGAGGVSTMLSSLGIAAPAGVGGGGLDYGRVALRILNSRNVVDRLVEDFDIIEKYGLTKSAKTKSRQLILDNSDFTYDSITGTLTIGYQDIDPVWAKDIVDRMVELLVEWFATWGGTANQRNKNLLEKKLEEVMTEIDGLESQIQAFQEKHGVLNVEELATTQAAMLAELRSQLLLAEMEIKTHSSFSKIEDPVLRRLKSDRQNILEFIRQIEEGTGGYSRFGPARNDLPELALEFTHFTLALQIQRRIYESLSQQYEIAKLSLESEPVFQVLEWAEVPDQKSGPQRSQIVLITVFAAFAGGVIIAFFLNALKNLYKRLQRPKNLTGKI